LNEERLEFLERPDRAERLRRLRANHVASVIHVLEHDLAGDPLEIGRRSVVRAAKPIEGDMGGLVAAVVVVLRVVVDREEGPVGQRAPYVRGQRVVLRVLRAWRAGDAQRLPRRGVGQADAGAGRADDPVLPRERRDPDASARLATQVVPPGQTVHGLAVLGGAVPQHVGRDDAAPDAVAASFVTVPLHEHGVTGEHRHAEILPSLLVDRDIALRARGDLHGGGDHAVLAVGSQTAFAAMIAIGHRTATGEAVEVPQRAEQRVVIDLDAALLAQEQRRQYLRPGRVHQAASDVPGIDARAPVHPSAAELLAALRVVTVVLHDRQHRFVAGAQVILAARDAVVAVVPGVIADPLHVLGEPVEVRLDGRHVLVVAGREKEQARQGARDAALVEPGSELAPVGVELSSLLDDLLRLAAVKRPSLAVGTQHGNANGLLSPRCTIRGGDVEDHLAVGSLGVGERVAQRDEGILALQRDPVDSGDDFALLEPAVGGRAGHGLLDLEGNSPVDPHHHARHADVAEGRLAIRIRA